MIILLSVIDLQVKHGFNLQRKFYLEPDRFETEIFDFLWEHRKPSLTWLSIIHSTYDYHSYYILHYFSQLYYMIYGQIPSFDLLLGAYLHDIGKLKNYDLFFSQKYVPPENRYKIEQHVTDGYNFLTKNFSQHPIVADMAFYHHERSDGTGYPTHQKKLPPMIALLASIDVFVALQEPRKYRKNLINIHDEWQKEKVHLYSPYTDYVDKILTPHT